MDRLCIRYNSEMDDTARLGILAICSRLSGFRYSPFVVQQRQMRTAFDYYINIRTYVSLSNCMGLYGVLFQLSSVKYVTWHLCNNPSLSVSLPDTYFPGFLAIMLAAN